MADPYLAITRDSIGLNPRAPIWLDVAHFLGRLDQANAEPDQAVVHLRAALDLYGGEFLAGFHLAQAGAFDEWQAGEREWLHRRAVEALYRLAQACASEGSLLAALDYLRAAAQAGTVARRGTPAADAAVGDRRAA